MKPSWLPLAELSSSPTKEKETRRNMDVCTAASTGHRKRRVSKKNRSWQRRLHLRKTVVQPPAMQSRDKTGPKKIAKKWEPTSVWPPSKEPRREARVTNDGGGSLRFPCSQCGDNSDYAPKDLARHFVEKHGGSPPVFSCHMCTFSAHEFSYLQVHLLSHKDTFSTCSMCDDNVQRTWPEFSAHLTMYHCSDGKYSCETCKKFSTCDFRVFLDHIYKHNLTVEEKEVGGRQFCGGEAPEKWLLNKSVKTSRVCQNGNQRKDGRRVHSIAMKPSERIPRAKTRLTRSTVRDTCWLTQDCLSLPGKEFLDKYCHLSDPQTTLEETQQFLMQSVAGETDDQKWTKALKSVLSNVPQKNSENGVAPNTSDLAVLTVKNKITLAQNGASYAKRLKMASADKEPTGPESADGDSLCASDQNGFNPNLKNQAPCLTENKLRSDFSSPGAGTQENRENRKLKTDSEIQENGEKLEEPADDVGICKSRDLKLPSESEGKMTKRRRRRRKVQRKPEGKALKIVIKKKLVKGKRWVSQSSSSPKHVEIDGHVEPPNSQQNSGKGFPADLPDPSRRTAICDSVRPTEDATMENDGHREIQVDVEESQDFSDKRGSAEGTSETKPVAASVTDVETSNGEPALQTSNEETEEKRSPADSSPHVEANLDSCVELPAEQSDQGSRCEEASPDFSQPLLSGVQPPEAEASRREPPAPAARPQRRLAPKHQPRTLRLVAVNPSQPVKRPAGDQPVVVLNHPDADVPQVSRIMEVVNKYRQVRRVLLSRQTLRALSALSGGGAAAAAADDLTDDQGESSVQERFTLRLKFRRVSRKKYEIVGVTSPTGRVASSRVSCWFCGRVFASQQEMMLHRQRHLMDWRKPNCEKS